MQSLIRATQPSVAGWVEPSDVALGARPHGAIGANRHLIGLVRQAVRCGVSTPPRRVEPGDPSIGRGPNLPFCSYGKIENPGERRVTLRLLAGDEMDQRIMTLFIKAFSPQGTIAC